MAEYHFRALIVASVSTKDQAKKDRFSLKDQLSSGHAVCREHNWPVVDEVVIEGHSRNYEYLDELLADSPDYAKVLQWIKSGQIDVIVVRHDDRLWRTMDLQYDVSRIMRRNNVQLYDISKPKEPVPPDQLRHKAIDKFMDSVGGFSAEVENEKRTERMAGILRARVAVRGLHPGNIPYGYRRVSNDLPAEQVPEEIQWIRWVGEQRRAYLGFGLIAHRLNARGARTREGHPWTRVQIGRLLRNPYYAGYAKYGEVLQRGKHEPAWTEAEWQEIQEVNRRAHGLGNRRGGAGPHELTGLCYCSVCGARICYESRPGWVALDCGAHGRNFDRGNPPHRNYHGEKLVLQALIQIVQAELSDPAAFAEARRRERGTVAPDLIVALEAEIADRRKRIERWNSALEVGGIGPLEFRDRRSELEVQIAALQQQAGQLRVQIAAAAQIEAAMQLVAKDIGWLPDLKTEDRRGVWVELISRVWLRPGKRAPTKEDIEWR